jgi:hypothetical protein
MAGIMILCQNWGNRGCNPNVAKHSRPSEVQNSESVPILPVGDELKKLDEICLKCSERFLIANRKECPYCEGHHIETTGGSHKAKGYALARGYKCLSCGGAFWIYES